MEAKALGWLVAFLFSSVGFIYFRHGKRMALPLFMIVGVVLMIYPYFVDSLWLLTAIGGILCAVPFVVK